VTLSVGLIGLGEVAQLMHLPLLADDDRFRIAAVTDVSPSLTAYIANRYGVAKQPASADALISDPEVDAVFILTPDHLHAELLEKAIRAGKHVFIEKPACLNAAQLDPLLELDKGNDKIVFVGYMRRFSRPFTELKKRLPDHRDIRHVRVRDIIREAPFFVAQTRNIFRPTDVPTDVIAEGRRRTEEMLRAVMGADCPPDALRAYQVLTGLSSHSFSAMRELLGTPKSIAMARQHRGETVVVLFDYGHFTCVYEAVIDDVSRFDAGIEVLTQNRHFKMNYDTPYVRNLPTRLEITTSSDTETGTEVIGPVYQDPFRIELDAFHESVVTGNRPKTTLEDSMNDLRLFKEIGRFFYKGSEH
jgi:myo-inositol 2-dehydrogenase/D-chiro-inositol 1-dehydrogenase